MIRFTLIVAVAIAAAGATGAAGAEPAPAGSVQHLDQRASRLVASNAAVEILATGFGWSEGPVWIKEGGYLLFSDVPANRIHRWTEKAGNSLFLHPSGGTTAEGFREPGANGLRAAGRNSILLADQGNRAIALLDLRTKAKRFVARRFGGKKFNSPNDLAVGADGSIWFTDPPYGLNGLNASPLKEQPVNGVYRITPDGQVALVEAGLSFPNGIAFSPNGRTLYVSNSDPARAVILAFDVSPGGAVSRRRVFADMTALSAKGMPGLPDGIAVDQGGNLWATGPGGVHILAPDGRALGLISTGGPVSNCTFGGADGRTLFMTSGSNLAAVRTHVQGAPHRFPRFARQARAR
jgi:gluconolactonase